MITTIIFDIGGVLITPSEKVTPIIISQLFGIPLEAAVTEYTRVLPALRIGKTTIKEIVDAMKSRYPVASDIPDLEAAYIQYYKKQAIINSDIMHMLSILRTTHTLIGFSNMIDLHVRCNEERQLFQYFHTVYISSVTGKAKPDRGAFEYMIADATLTPGECLYIDDTRDNIEVGVTFGFRCHLFESTLELEGFLKKEGVF